MKLCVECKFCGYLHQADTYVCRCPHNIKAEVECPVTGHKTIQQYIGGDCFDLRASKDGCGEQGLWWLPRDAKP